MVMGTKTLLLFSKKVSCPSFKARTRSPRHNQELVKQVHSPLEFYRALTLKLSSARHL
jgi:hypothetical protein